MNNVPFIKENKFIDYQLESIFNFIKNSKSDYNYGLFNTLYYKNIC